ncbi:MAG: pyridoxal 5'-phosphate synthase glutaminase subunit PdxT [Dehalococcoidia bacterium]|nr:pyridoxal 5'-phosphate synthase glutaminase subunit PdxT [Dehalococcoidia bacterium]
MKKLSTNKIIIGILSLQGDFKEHSIALEKLNIQHINVRKKNDLDQIDGLIIPGGESTTIIKLLKRTKLFDLVQKKIFNGLPTWGTCAGAILLAKKVTNMDQQTLKILDIEIERNGYGRQANSFTEEVHIGTNKKTTFPGIFIRAPKIKKITKNISCVGMLSNKEIVAIEYKNIFATTFHPELTDDLSMHEYFIKKIVNKDLGSL